MKPRVINCGRDTRVSKEITDDARYLLVGLRALGYGVSLAGNRVKLTGKRPMPPGLIALAASRFHELRDVLRERVH